MDDHSGAEWHKSTHSNNGGACVEVAVNLATTDDVVLVRDSKNPTGPVLRFTRAEWTAFLAGAGDGEFNI